MFFQKLKRMHIQCILSLLYMSSTLAETTPSKALISCSNAASKTSGEHCGDTGSGTVYCITAETNGSLFQSKHTETESCTALSSTGDLLFSADSTELLDLASSTAVSGLLYKCTDNSGITCTRIAKEGYYLASKGDTKYLMNCVASTGVCTKVSSPVDGYYIPSADDTTNKLYSCTSSSCTPKTSSDIVTNKFYGNGDGATSGSPVTYTSLITCTTQDSCFKKEVQAAGFYLDAQTTANVFTCSYTNNAASCNTSAGSTTESTGYIDAGTPGNVIICKSSGCSTITNGNAQAASNGGKAQNTGFLDAGLTGKLIICSNSGGCNSDTVTGAQGQAILDGYSYDGTDGFTKVIKYATGQNPTWALDTSTASSNVAFIDIGTPTGTTTKTYPNVIVYENSKYVVKAGSEKSNGIAYMDATDKKNLIRCQSNACTSAVNEGSSENPKIFIDGIDNTKIIKCTDTSSVCTDPAAGSSANETKFYLDGFNSANVIKCENGSACTSSAGVKTNGYGYLDAGSANNANVIICNDTSCSSIVNGNAQAANNGNAQAAVPRSGEDAAADSGSVQNTGFLDAGTTGNLIICTSSGCTSSAVSGAQGQAILDGKSYATTFTQLIKWKTGTTWEFVSTPSQAEAYIDAGSCTSGDKCPNVITYDATDKYTVKAADVATSGIAYIDATNKMKIIKCTSDTCTSGANDATSTTPAYYIDGIDDTKIIKCTGTSVECVFNSGSNEDDEYKKYYLDSINGGVLECAIGGGQCAIPSGTADSTDGKGYVDAGSDDKNVIVCVNDNGNTVCSSIPYGNAQAAPAGGVPQNTGFIDAGNSGNLIICSTSGCVTNVITGADGQGILDGKSYTSQAGFTKVIKKDSLWSLSSTEVNSGEAYIDVSSGSSENGYPNIIVKTDSKFSVIAGNSTTGYAYIDVESTSNVIKCPESKCTSSSSGGAANTPVNFIDGTNPKKIIKCVASCSIVDPEATEELSKYYIDGSTSSNVITCEKDVNCVSDVSNVGSGIAYIDGNDPKKLFSCVDNTGCAAVSSVSSTSGEVYIDGSDKENKYKKIIRCESGSDCVSTNESTDLENGDLFFIDATDNKSVIKCTKTDGCASTPGSTNDGEAYIDGLDNKNVIICESTVCTSDSGNTDSVDTYVNADDTTKIITCSDDECSVVSTNARTNNSEYYARFGDGSAEIIKCHATLKCKVDSTVPQANAVFINGLFRESTTEDDDNNKSLIICDASKVCTPTAPIFNEPQSSQPQAQQERKRDTQQSGTKQVEEQSATPIPSYYVNGDADSSQRIIKCPAEGKKCTTMNAADKNVYLNANYDADDNNKPLIKCTTNESVLNCAEVEETSSDENRTYYLNAGTSSKEDAVIECAASCGILEAKSGQIYINNNDKSQLISCSDTGCILKTSNASKEKNEIYLNSSDIDNKGEAHANDLIICTKGEGEDAKVTCVPSNGVENGVYLNADDKSKIIICLKDEECKYVSSDATTLSPKYYVNGDPTNDTDEKLKNDLIKCKKVNNGVTCDVISGNHGDTYLNANTDDEANPLIVCTTEEGCIVSASDTDNNDNLPVYYVNTGSGLADKKLNDTLIKCTMENDKVQCDIKRDTAVNQVYVNYGTNKSENQLIKCTANACKTYSSNPTENNNEYYINSGDVDEASLTNDIIECVCAKEEGKETCSVTCTEMNSPGVGVYLNSNYSSVGDTNQLISCTNEDGCKGITSASDSKTTEYYVNAEATDLTNAIIFCSNKKCEKQTAVLNTYYVGVGEDPEINGLIECIKTEKEETTQTQTTQTQGQTQGQTQQQTQQQTQATGQNAKRGTVTEEKCKLNLSNSYQGYYLNAGSNKAINQVIVCDSSEGCKSEKVDLGYYVNAGDSTKPIIKCEKEGSECTSDESPKCPADENATAGDYCYEEDQLKFFVSSNSTAIVATKSDDYYAFAEIASGNFPGIKTTTGSLFKISRYFINRFYKGGVVMIDKNGKLVDNLSSSDQSDISLYECNESTKLCTEKPGCTSNTYMFDSENGKAVFCNSGKLEYAEFTGYVIDSNRMVGTNHPYIIECQNNGAKCTSMKPKTSSYFENSGYDSTTNSLIECSNNNCSTVVADVGYYVGHEGEGIIQCTSSSSCTYSVMKNKSVKYVNAGSNKTSKAIIECSKNKCSAAKAKIGYYMTYSNTILIQCTSPSNCVEFTPTVNYYDNADSSESSNSIINCAQSSQVITCAPEATNNGFYMSSSPNVLIRCKSGSKCKTVVVKNGIFRGALKGLSSSNKRSDEEDIELEEGDGKSVAMPRDSDEAYGIIRCVAGKCSALSPSEVASIPVCEFNNNKCYITLEYSMTKSATTSISAGNICTNADRSVFYFATDTIVVKPNVISGVTATYVYTTTNSNCLEVNDSYTDMYFTVGSNIFTLDQGSVLQFYETGYYFINTSKNTLVSGNDIDAYNDENVKLYKCNGSSCSITDKPDSLTYYVDVNKRIFKYNINNDAYSFAYDKDIMCIFANNKCTPNADLKNKEFCITYKGELALVKQDIKNRETGECYKASSITNTIYGYSQYLYNMNMFSAEMVDETGYYIISLSTNTTVVSKNYKTKNNNLVVYGCQLSSCKEYTPDEDTYYYDARAKNILRYKDGIWSSPSTSGYAYISIDPATTYIYRFTKNLDEIKINGIANYGYYYTVDGEMYHCDRDENGECTPIDSSGYYFTNAGEVYYCVHDSENIEPTECTKQACVSGQYYYIDEAYYRCESSSSLVPVMSRYCSYNDNVIINFPLALTEEFPEKIKQAIEGVEKNNNSTAIVSRRGKNYLESVSGVFTNCTYNVEETKSTFDLVCVNNYVSIDENTDDVKICSMEQLGYVECIEDEENPEKCNVSGAFPMVRPALFTIIMLAFSLLLLNQF